MTPGIRFKLLGTCTSLSTAFISLLLSSSTASALEALPEFVRGFLAQHCLECHAGSKPEGDIDLDLIETDWQTPPVPEFWERVCDVLVKREMPPTDVDPPSDPARKEMIGWLQRQLLKHSGAAGTIPRRLNRQEYQNTIRDLFDLPTFQVPDAFPADDVAHGFDNVAEGLILSPPLMSQYLEVATRVADEILPPDSGPPTANPRRYEIGVAGLATSEGGAETNNRFRLVSSRNMASIAVWPIGFEAPQSGIYRLTVDAAPYQTDRMYYEHCKLPFRVTIYARKKTEQVYDSFGDVRRIGQLELHSAERQPQSFAFDVELFRGEIFGLHWDNGPVVSEPSERELSPAFLGERLTANWRFYAAMLQLYENRSLNQSKLYDATIALMNNGALDSGDPRLNSLPKHYGGGLGFTMHNFIMQFVHEELRRFGPAVDVTDVRIEGPLRLIEDEETRTAKARTRQFLGPQITNGTEWDVAASVMRRFLPRAFRRPVGEEELRDYVTIVVDHVRSRSSLRLEDGLHLAVRRVLVSPRFLYRGLSQGRLDDFDLATRLSYFLTSSPPDKQLAAAAGELSNPDVLKREMLRLLESPKCVHFVRSFTGQWLGTRLLKDIMPDPRLLKFYDAHREALIQETELFFAEMLRENRPLDDFIDPGFSYRSALLNEIYGDNLSTFDMQRVTFDRGGRHGGITGLASVMMATANGVDTHPVHRGVWMLENVFGTSTPAPPENVPAIAPDTTRATSLREQLAAHASDRNCARCHQRIDPLGMVLENFDPVGRWRDHYPVYVAPADGEATLEKEFYDTIGEGTRRGPAVDAVGVLPDETRLEDVTDLRRYLLENIDMFSKCLTRKLMIYATGRPLSFGDRQIADRVVRELKADGNGFRDLIGAIVLSEAFATR